mmetsp:Transcript_27583/g.58926  ORF Transcript_27583/g.58926 Transcript_27583/m.58926 type:complete len:210 (-) Transcript_27583:34-663(-)
MIQFSIQTSRLPPRESLGLAQTPLTERLPSLPFTMLFNNLLSHVRMGTTSIHSHYRNIHTTQLVLFLYLKFERAVLFLAYRHTKTFIIIPSTVFVLAPYLVDFLNGTALECVRGSGGVEHGSSVEFAASANRISADEAKRHSVRNRTGSDLGSVAGHDAIILAVNTPGVTTLQCSLRAASAERGVLLTLGTAGFHCYGGVGVGAGGIHC